MRVAKRVARLVRAFRKYGTLFLISADSLLTADKFEITAKNRKQVILLHRFPVVADVIAAQWRAKQYVNAQRIGKTGNTLFSNI